MVDAFGDYMRLPWRTTHAILKDAGVVAVKPSRKDVSSGITAPVSSLSGDEQRQFQQKVHTALDSISQSLRLISEMMELLVGHICRDPDDPGVRGRKRRHTK
ncbi:hypothetical protein F5Y03DRAFT_400976 [Xylaria venustula]|nr:hypothetical protein F5Y03DRAFT_400976 [Xylaria venustula]